MNSYQCYVSITITPQRVEKMINFLCDRLVELKINVAQIVNVGRELFYPAVPTINSDVSFTASNVISNVFQPGSNLLNSCNFLIHRYTTCRKCACFAFFVV